MCGERVERERESLVCVEEAVRWATFSGVRKGGERERRAEKALKTHAKSIKYTRKNPPIALNNPNSVLGIILFGVLFRNGT